MSIYGRYIHKTKGPTSRAERADHSHRPYRARADHLGPFSRPRYASRFYLNGPTLEFPPFQK